MPSTFPQKHKWDKTRHFLYIAVSSSSCLGWIFYFSLVTMMCVCSVLGLGTQKHLFGARKASWIGLKYLFFVAVLTERTLSDFSWKITQFCCQKQRWKCHQLSLKKKTTHLVLTPAKWLEIPADVLKSSNCLSAFLLPCWPVVTTPPSPPSPAASDS